MLSPSEVARPVDDWEAGNCSCKSSKFVEQQKVILSGGNHHILVAQSRFHCLTLALRRGHEAFTPGFCLATRCIEYELGKKGARHAFCLAHQSVIRNLNERIWFSGEEWGPSEYQQQLVRHAHRLGWHAVRDAEVVLRPPTLNVMLWQVDLSSKQRLSVQTFLRFCRLRRCRPVQRLSWLVHGAEIRVAETKAVNRALRKEYGLRRGTAAARHRTDLS